MQRSREHLPWRRNCNTGACLEVAVAGPWAYLRNSRDPHGTVLRITRDEWEAFHQGVLDGMFEFPDDDERAA